MSKKHPDLSKLDSLLSNNPTWAVKITDVSSGQSLPMIFEGSKKTWVHKDMLPATMQDHVLQLVKTTGMSHLKFEIRRRNGNRSYVAVSKKNLPQPFFKIKISGVMQDDGDNNAFAKAISQPSQPISQAPQPQMYNPIKGLNEAQQLDLYGQSIHKGFIERELQQTKNELHDAKQRETSAKSKYKALKKELEKRDREDFQNKLLREKQDKPSLFDKLAEKATNDPESLTPIFEGVTGLLGALMPVKNPSGLNQAQQPVDVTPELTPLQKRLMDYVTQREDKVSRQLYDLANFMQSDPEFYQTIDELMVQKINTLMKPA